MEIPVLGIPILNRGDLLIRCINSIDYPVGKLVVINNGVNPTVFRAIKMLEKTRPNLVHLAPGYNMGVAASWNRIMSDFPAPFHFICSNDILFQRGNLQKLVESYHGQSGPTMIIGNHGMAYFMLNKEAVDKFGTFDENFYPAYMEDCDWMRRVRLLGHDYVRVEVDSVHGEAPSWGSSTIFSNKDYREKNAITHGLNGAYYLRKWGGEPDKELFTNPFNDPNWPLSKWEPEGLRASHGRVW